MSPVFRQGLWTQNPALVQLLGLCPLLAVSTTLVNGLALGLASLLVLLSSNAGVSLLRGQLHSALRIPSHVLLIASSVTVVERLMHAWTPELYALLGIFIPIITTNCLILARAEACARRSPLPQALADALAMGGGFAAVLAVLGALRELLARGTLLAGAELLFGPIASGWTLRVHHGGLLLAALPPGAFIALGLLLAARNQLMVLRARRKPSSILQPDTPR